MPMLHSIRRIITIKRAVLFTVSLAVVALIVMAVRPEALDVDTAVVCHQPLRVTVDAEGKTRVRDRYVIAAPVSGRLQRLEVREGDLVRAGDLVARIAPAPFDEPTERQARARVAAAGALAREAVTRVRLAESAALQAHRDAKRTRVLYDAGAVSARTLEEAELFAQRGDDDLAAAREQATAARAQVEQARSDLLHVGGGPGAVVLVRAPATGRVLRVVDPSERVIASGTTIVEIGDTRALEVVVDVLSSDAAIVRPGMPVSLTGWGDDAAVQGTVQLVEPAATTRISALGVEEQRVDVLVDVPGAPATLGDGYRVDAHIAVWEAHDVLSVPTSALVRNGAGWAVFVVEGGRAALRDITVGRTGGAVAQVLAGIEDGEAVIVFPSDKVRNGVKVAIGGE